MTSRPQTLAIVLGLALLFLPTRLPGQVNQQTIARQLGSRDRAERSRALEQARLLGRQNTGGEVRAALLTLLKRNNEIAADARLRKESVERTEDPIFIAQVAHVVSQLGDPRTIPELAGALGTGSTLVRDALAEFGERAAPDILRIVTSPESHYSAVDEGLIALRFLVEGRPRRPLSAGTLEQIRNAAKQRLSGRQYFTTVWYAMDLAMALGDPELRSIVEALAASDDAVAATGIDDPAVIQQTRARAVRRLAGEPALPKFRNIDERDRLLNDRRR